MSESLGPHSLRLDRVLGHQGANNGARQDYTSQQHSEQPDNTYHASENYYLNHQQGLVEAFFGSERFRHVKRAHSVSEVVHCLQPACSVSQRQSSDRFYELQRDSLGEVGLNSVGVSDALQVLLASRYCSWMFVTPWPLNDSGVRKRSSSVAECIEIIQKINASQSRFETQRAVVARRPGGAVKTQASELMEALNLHVPLVCKGAAETDTYKEIASNIKRLIAEGVAGVYINDRVSESVKFQVTPSEPAVVASNVFLRKLDVARYIADCFQSPLVIIGKTVLSECKWLQSQEDSRDHVFVLGSAYKNAPKYELQSGKRKLQQWEKDVKPRTYVQVVQAQQRDQQEVDSWIQYVATRPGFKQMEQYAKQLLGHVPYFDVSCCQNDRRHYMIDSTAFLKQRVEDQITVTDVIWVPFNQTVAFSIHMFQRIAKKHPHVKFQHSYSSQLHRGLSGMSEAEEQIQQDAQIKANGVLQLLPEGTLLASVLGQDVMLQTLQQHGAAACLRQIQQRIPLHQVQNQQQSHH